jgi:anti-anti-sigma regulatory factor
VAFTKYRGETSPGDALGARRGATRLRSSVSATENDFFQPGTRIATEFLQNCEETAVLRINRQLNHDSTILFRLEGKLLEPWVDELKKTISVSQADPGVIQFDLSALTFADSLGVLVLAELLGQGATLVACSPYVAALLNSHK